MKTRFYHAILKPGLLGLTSISLAACASGRPSHGPPSGNDEFRGQSDRPTGFAIKPVALLFSEMDENDDRAVTTDELASGPGVDAGHGVAQAAGEAGGHLLGYRLGQGLEYGLDNLLGAVIKKGRENNIPVPASAALYSALYNFRVGTPA